MEMFLKDDNGDIKSFQLTEEQIELQKLGYDMSIDGNGDIEFTSTSISDIEEKKKVLKNKTADEIINESTNYFDTGILGKELGDFLVKILLEDNPHKENQYTRYILNLLIKVVLQGYTPVQADIDFINTVVELGDKTEAVLGKFKNPNA